MAKQDVEDSVSLFPFLSILACVIGILVLMITAIALGQIGRDDPAAQADAEAARQAALEAQQRVEQFRIARQQTEADRQRLLTLQHEMGRVDWARERLQESREHLKALQAQTKAAQDAHQRADEELRRLQAERDRLTPQIAKLEEQLKPLRDQREKLRAEVAKRKEPPPEAQVVVQPSGSGVDMNPTFVECAGASVVLHDGPQPVRIPVAELSGHPQYMQLLEKVKRTARGTVIFLIRPDGVGSYNLARHIARTNYVTNGKLAIGGQGQLDLTRFGKKS